MWHLKYPEQYERIPIHIHNLPTKQPQVPQRVRKSDAMMTVAKKDRRNFQIEFMRQINAS